MPGGENYFHGDYSKNLFHREGRKERKKFLKFPKKYMENLGVPSVF